MTWTRTAYTIQMSLHLDKLIDSVLDEAEDSDKRCHVVIMSNGSFDGIYSRLPEAMQRRSIDP